jgi:Uma2 family endonuclease
MGVAIDHKTRTIMSQAITRFKRLRLGPRAAGMLLTPEEFDRAEFKEGWRYELINEVLVVSPTPSRNERDPNEELGYSLRSYQEMHPQGAALDLTLHEETIETRRNRRRAGRVIWAGLGHLPDLNEPPTIVIELVSRGRINRERDYVAKRAEYREIGVKEYWIIDRFAKSMTVFIFTEQGDRELVIPAGQTYATGLLPGYELPLGKLIDLANRWARKGK